MTLLAEHLFDLLHSLGVRHAFGIPGDFALDLYHFLAQSPIEPVVVTQEPFAGFAADGYARVRGLGVVVVTYGVGVLNVVNSAAQAYAEKSPVLVIGGAPGLKERQVHKFLHHTSKSFESQHRIFKEVTAATAALDNPLTADIEMKRVLRTILTYKRPGYLEVPRDMVRAKIAISHEPILLPKKSDEESLKECIGETVEMIENSKKACLLVGVETQRLGIEEEVMELAEKLCAPVAATMLGKSAFPEDHPLYMGVYTGAVGDPHVKEVVESSDCLIMLGTFLSDLNLGMFTAHLNPSTAILATSEDISIRHHHYHDVCLEDFIKGLAMRVERVTCTLPPKVPLPAPPASDKCLSVKEMMDIIDSFIDDRTIVVTDVGDCMFGAMALRTHSGTSFLAPAYYTSMGFGIPGAIGAQLADSSRRVLVITGDGGFQMTAAEMITAKRLGLNLIVVIMNNGTFATLRQYEQEAPYLDVTAWDYAAFGRLLGGEGYTVRTAAEFKKALSEAKKSSLFSIIDVLLDKEAVSPLLYKLRTELLKRASKPKKDSSK